MRNRLHRLFRFFVSARFPLLHPPNTPPPAVTLHCTPTQRQRVRGRPATPLHSFSSVSTRVRRPSITGALPAPLCLCFVVGCSGRRADSSLSLSCASPRRATGFLLCLIGRHKPPLRPPPSLHLTRVTASSLHPHLRSLGVCVCVCHTHTHIHTHTPTQSGQLHSCAAKSEASCRACTGRLRCSYCRVALRSTVGLLPAHPPPAFPPPTPSFFLSACSNSMYGCKPASSRQPNPLDLLRTLSISVYRQAACPPNHTTRGLPAALLFLPPSLPTPRCARRERNLRRCANCSLAPSRSLHRCASPCVIPPSGCAAVALSLEPLLLRTLSACLEREACARVYGARLPLPAVLDDSLTTAVSFFPAVPFWAATSRLDHCGLQACVSVSGRACVC